MLCTWCINLCQWTWLTNRRCLESWSRLENRSDDRRNLRKFMSLNMLHDLLGTIQIGTNLHVSSTIGEVFSEFQINWHWTQCQHKGQRFWKSGNFMVKCFFGRSSYIKMGIWEMMTSRKISTSTQRKPYSFFSDSVQIEFQTTGILDSKISIGKLILFRWHEDKVYMFACMRLRFIVNPHKFTELIQFYTAQLNQFATQYFLIYIKWCPECFISH